MLYNLAKPFIFALEAERAHGLTIAGLKTFPMSPAPKSDPVLSTSVAGLDFVNPIGMAPGFDKNGEVPDALIRMGFGFAEVGTLTPLPQTGNPKPRIFRLVEDKAVINRLGFNNEGHAAAEARLQARAWRAGIAGEFVAASDWGLGYAIFDSREELDTAFMLVGVATIALVGFIMEKLMFEKIEKVTVVKWGMMTETGGGND